MRRWSILAGAVALLLLLVAPVYAGFYDVTDPPDDFMEGPPEAGHPSVDIVAAGSGFLPDGRPWVVVQFARPWPPPQELFSWFLTVQLGAGGEFLADATTQWHDGSRDRFGSWREGPFEFEEITRSDGSVVIIFPAFSPVPDQYVVMSGVMQTPDGSRVVDELTPPVDLNSARVGDPTGPTEPTTEEPTEPTTEEPTEPTAEEPTEPAPPPITIPEVPGRDEGWPIVAGSGIVAALLGLVAVQRRRRTVPQDPFELDPKDWDPKDDPFPEPPHIPKDGEDLGPPLEWKLDVLMANTRLLRDTLAALFGVIALIGAVMTALLFHLAGLLGGIAALLYGIFAFLAFITVRYVAPAVRDRAYQEWRRRRGLPPGPQ